MAKPASFCILVAIASVVCSCGACKKGTPQVKEQSSPDTVQTPWSYQVPWPFDPMTIQQLRASPKKVFAHYFTQFPLSEDNKDPRSDYYQTEYLSPNGEGNIHAGYGGYLRIRPIPQSPRPESDWMELDMEQEIRMAIAIGIDGFACDILSISGYHWQRMLSLLEAAHQVDPGFKIMLMPDMNALSSHQDALDSVITVLSAYPSVYKLDDGRLVVAPYNAQDQSAQWWTVWLSEMKQSGIDIAFFPVFQGWQHYAAAFAPFSYGLSDWGWRSVDVQRSWLQAADQAHAYHTKWMMPVAPQDMRPKSFRYWEAENSSEFRLMWENAIQGGADWVQLITWNDYSEHTVVEPSTGTQFGFYDLAAYYINWFKTGTPPQIKRDALYYFYRTQSFQAKPDLTKQTKPFDLDKASDPAADYIELLAFLTKPGALEIQINGKSTQKMAPAGVTSFRIPLSEGKPIFRLYRNDSAEIVLPGAFTINNHITYQNLLYYSGSNSRSPVTWP